MHSIIAPSEQRYSLSLLFFSLLLSLSSLTSPLRLVYKYSLLRGLCLHPLARLLLKCVGLLFLPLSRLLLSLPLQTAVAVETFLALIGHHEGDQWMERREPVLLVSPHE